MRTFSKPGGIVIKVDGNGRIGIPSCFRRRLDIQKGSELEIYPDGGALVVKKYEPLAKKDIKDVNDAEEVYQEILKECGVTFEEVQRDIEKITTFSKEHGEPLEGEYMVDFVVRSAKQRFMMS